MDGPKDENNTYCKNLQKTYNYSVCSSLFKSSWISANQWYRFKFHMQFFFFWDPCHTLGWIYGEWKENLVKSASVIGSIKEGLPWGLGLGPAPRKIWRMKVELAFVLSQPLPSLTSNPTPTFCPHSNKKAFPPIAFLGFSIIILSKLGNYCLCG
mgnify:CR=1 FL=1